MLISDPPSCLCYYSFFLDINIIFLFLFKNIYIFFKVYIYFSGEISILYFYFLLFKNIHFFFWRDIDIIFFSLLV